MRRVALIQAALILSAQHAFGESPSLIIDSKFLDLGSSRIAFELRNPTEKVATAWRLALVRIDESGAGVTTIRDQDYYMGLGSEAHAGPRSRGPILPGRVGQEEWPIDASAAIDGAQFSLRVLAVVFEDGSISGDAGSGNEILAARVARLDELEDHVEFLERGIESNEAPVDLIRTELTRLGRRREADDRRAPGPSSTAVAATRSSIEADLESLLAVSETERVSLEALRRRVDQLRREIELGRKQTSKGPHRSGVER